MSGHQLVEKNENVAKRDFFDCVSFRSGLIEGEDYYFAQNGLMVFTNAYHIKRGFCCKNGCKHCPYYFIK